MNTSLRTSLAALAVVAATAAFPSASHAIAFDLTSDHCTGGCLGGLTSSGTVSVTEIGTNQLHFAISLASGFTIINTGFDGSFAFDLNPNQTVTYSNVTGGFTPVGGNTVGAQNLTHFDGFNSFEYAVLRDVQGGGSGLPTLDFDLTGSNLTLASLQQNPFGAFFVVDVRGANGNTGLVDASFEPVPGPIVGAGLPGLIFACGSLLALGRRRRQKLA